MLTFLNNFYSDKQRGDVAIFIAVTTLIFLMIVGITVFILVFSQLNMSKQEDQSVKAFYAADSGAEECLYQAFKGNPDDPCYNVALPPPSTEYHILKSNFSNGASFDAWRAASSTEESIINSLGKLQSTSRKVELIW